MFQDTAGHEDLSKKIIACGIRVHEFFGPTLYESVYKNCLVMELREVGLRIEQSRPVPLVYRGQKLETTFYPDLIVDGIVVVELKAVEILAAVHTAQLLTYLKLRGLPIGLLMNFNVQYLKQGVRRVVARDFYVGRRTLVPNDPPDPDRT
jgi:GxxExxY protein